MRPKPKSMRSILRRQQTEVADAKINVVGNSAITAYDRLAHNEIDDRLWHGIYNQLYEIISSSPIYNHRSRFVNFNESQNSMKDVE